MFSYDLSPTSTIADLKGMVHQSAEGSQDFSPELQQFMHNGLPLWEDQKTLQELGVQNQDLIRLNVEASPAASGQAQSSLGAAQQSQRQPSMREVTNPTEIENFRRGIAGNQQAMSEIRRSRPALADAIHDSARFREVWMGMLEQERQNRALNEQQLASLESDQFNPDNQAKIEEMIREQAVQENLQMAYEYHPEVFARVTMLYVPVQVNSHSVKAFVDSGAQTTIMSPSCAESCGIMRLIDKRYSGVAKGVGTAQILGRVHSAPIKIGNSTMSCSFTVMEGKDVDLLLGLDMLKRFQASIDLKRNKLVFGEDEVDFLGEADIPKNLEEAMQSEPTVSGPNGTEIGAVSGTVRPEGTSAAAAAGASSSSASSSGAAAALSSTPATTGGERSFQGQGRTLGSQPAQPSQPSAPSQPAMTGSGADPGWDQKVGTLMGMGFDANSATQALRNCNGNVDEAASLLVFGL